MAAPPKKNPNLDQRSFPLPKDPEMSMMDRLAEIRAMGGRDPLPDPTKVPGFGPNDPAIGQPLPLGPPLDPDLPKDWIDPELDEGKDPPYMQPPPSPLIPQAMKPAATAMPIDPNIQSLLDQGLVIVGRLGAWKGRQTTLSEAREKQARRLVLEQLQEDLDADLSEVVDKKRRRKAQGAAPDGGAPVPHPAPAPKRGRPRKS